MPELPEVETLRRQLAPRLEGRTIARLGVLDVRWCAPATAKQIGRALEGEQIERVARRGKYLQFVFSGGSRLLLHLRMTGNLLWEAGNGQLDRPHTRVVFDLDDGSRLLFVDARRFGTGRLFPGRGDADRYLDERLGAEPLGKTFTTDLLAGEAAGRKAPVKAFLLDQQRVAGIGNIYADEALFRARIHPLRPAGRLRRPDLERLRAAIVASLEAGIQAQGASIDDYRHYNGGRGTMQDEFRVHRRAGEPCPNCGREIVKLRAAGRGTYVCTRCQPPPRTRKAAR